MVEPPSDVCPSPYWRMPTTVTSLMPSCVASCWRSPTSTFPFLAISFAIATSPDAVGRRPLIGVYGLRSSGTLLKTKSGAPPVELSALPFAIR